MENAAGNRGRFRLWPLLLFLLSAMWLALFLWGASFCSGVSSTERPPNVGNFPETLSRLRPRAEDGTFSFLVMGDPHLAACTFEDFLERARAEDADFMVILGDMVRDPFHRAHRLLLHRLGRSDLPYPVFLVAGDDDVAGNYRWPGADFSLADFEELYGPSNFSFTHGGCLFVFFCAALHAEPEKNLDYLEGRLRARKEGARRTFVFMHFPPFHVSPGAPSTHGFIRSPRFFSMVDSYGVDAVFSGHRHGHWRQRREKTDFIVTAGGGGRLKKKGFGMFHHIMKVTVGEGGVSTELLVLPRNWSLWGHIRDWVYTHLSPWLRAHRTVAWVLLGLPLLGLAVGLRGLLRRRAEKSLRRTPANSV